MKWFLLVACWVLVGCGAIYGLVNGIVPHLLAPNLFPQAQAREVRSAPAGNAIVAAGQAVIAHRGEWVRYSTPQGAEYVAVCLPAFSPALVHRDA